MPETKGSGNGGRVAPRRDLLAIRAYRRSIKNTNPQDKNPFNTKKLRRLGDIVEASKAAGTFNRKDEKALFKLVKRVNHRSNSKGEFEMGYASPATREAWSRLAPQGGIEGRNQQINKSKPRTKGNFVTATDKNTNGIFLSEKGKKKWKGDGKGGPGKGGKGGNGGRGGRGGGRNRGATGISYSAPGPFEGPSRRDARTIVGNDINQQTKEYTNSAKAIRKAMQFDINNSNTLYNRSKGDLDYVYGETGDFIGKQNNKIDNRYDATRASTQAAYQQLQAQNAQQTGATRDAATAEQQRLGIQQAGMGQFDADANYMAGTANQSNSNNQANLSAMQAGANEIGGMLASMNSSSHAGALGRANSTRQDSNSQYRQDSRAAQQGILDQIMQLRSGRGAAVNELYAAQEANAYSRYAEQNQQNFSNTMASNQFNFEVSQQNDSNTWKKAELRQEATRQRNIRRSQREFASMQRQGGRVNQEMNDVFTVL